jgi:YHS domain-containing protein
MASLAMLATRRRGETCRTYLPDSGLTAQQIAHLTPPARLAIGAVTPNKIAACILAKLLHRRTTPNVATGVTPAPAELPELPVSQTALNPVCGMTVAIPPSHLHTTYNGRNFSCCCHPYKQLFERNPQHYLVQNKRTTPGRERDFAGTHIIDAPLIPLPCPQPRRMRPRISKSGRGGTHTRASGDLRRRRPGSSHIHARCHTPRNAGARTHGKKRAPDTSKERR